jgi:hypothetical protein
MEAKQIHDYARRFVGAHGDRAELEGRPEGRRMRAAGPKGTSGRLAPDSGRDQGDARSSCELSGRRGV